MKQLFNKLSLRGKLTFIITLTSCTILLLTIIAVVALQRMSLRSDLLQDVQILSQEISASCAVSMLSDDRQATRLALAVLAIKPDIVGAVVFDRNQEVIAEFNQGQATTATISKMRASTLLDQRHMFHSAHLDVFEPVVYEGEILGQLMVRTSLAELNDVTIRNVWIGLPVFAIYSLLAFLLATNLQRLISEPIKSLALSMRTVSKEKNYSYRIQKTSQDELGSLFDSFNEMLAEIEIRDKELQKNEVRLSHLAHHDPLTKLANRLLFHDRLDHSLARAKRLKSRLAILFIDLDRFKNINDSLGHGVGDKVLCVVAERLSNLVREADTIARLGGDEFVIILEHLRKKEDVERYVQKLLRELVQTIGVSDQELHVTASIGISLFPDSGEDSDSLMQAADLAMYQAKGRGSNHYQFYSADMIGRAHESLLMESQLRDALKNKELFLHYQPQFELKTGCLVGFEALIRWNNIDLGIVSPVDFIPVAEQTGLIVSIGEWVLYTACQQMKKIQEQWQLPLRIAVNISARQFLHPALVQTVAEVLYRTGLEPAFLELEITESMVMGNVDQAISTMTEFNQMGVKLAIDDFGTGYSSLEYLKNFPISRLKIDQSFVRELESNTNDRAIVNSIIALGKTMNLEVIAEGIETAEQFDILKQAGCDLGQGFLIGKPLPVDELLLVLDSVVVDNSVTENDSEQSPKLS